MMTNDIIYEYPSSDRILIIGDIHGDIKRFKNILIDANIINNNIEWIANPPNTIVIQLGDQVDSINRYPNPLEWEVINDTEMIYFTNFLNNIAISKGGKIISLIGNHELMNIIGNFSYVSEKSMKSNTSRYDLYKPCGTLSTILGKRPLVVKIGKYIFCHAGIRKHHIDIMNKYNKHISYINGIWRNFMLHKQVNIEDKEIFDKLILDNDGILWNREIDSKEEIDTVLNDLGCYYMFTGHNTVDSVKLIDKIWYVDTGISRAFGTNSYQYIDMSGLTITINQIDE